MKWIFVLISFWLTFVVSLASWWLYFGISILNRSPELLAQNDLVRHQKMLFQEGCVLILFLFGGGLALFYFVFRMYKEKSAKEKFFATFTHDIKTALFRLQLQIEKLGHVTGEGPISPILVQTRKIHLDLENGLDSTIGLKKDLYIESIGFKNFLSELHTQWPEFHIKLKGDDQPVLGDRKALHSIFKNLLHNSFFHGEADQVLIELDQQSNKVRCSYSDNGKVFEGDKETLGIIPHNSTQGSGFGLYIVRYWVEKMGGQLDFLSTEKGSLKIQIDLPKGEAL